MVSVGAAMVSDGFRSATYFKDACPSEATDRSVVVGCLCKGYAVKERDRVDQRVLGFCADFRGIEHAERQGRHIYRQPSRRAGEAKLPSRLSHLFRFTSRASKIVMSTHPKKTEFDYQVPDRTGDVIYAHDLSGNLTFLNQAGEELLGYSCDEALGLNITQIVPPEVAPQVRDEIVKSVASSIGTVYRIGITAKAGHRVMLEVSMRTVFCQGEPVQIEGIAVPVYDAQLSRTRLLS